MEQYNVTGMSCAACSSRVEKAVSSLDGVTSCAVNLLTNSMTVEGMASSQAIISAVEKARNQGMNLPIVYNCGGYEKVDSIRRLEGIVDVYLPDFKYFSSDISQKYSNAKDYAQVAKLAIEEMVRQQNKCVFDQQKIIKKGVIVRHLLLPGCLKDSKKVIRYLYSKYGDNIFISLMSQYTPLEHVQKYKELNRRVTNREYNQLVNYALELGVINGFTQDREVASESFIPYFDETGV